MAGAFPTVIVCELPVAEVSACVLAEHLVVVADRRLPGDVVDAFADQIRAALTGVVPPEWRRARHSALDADTATAIANALTDATRRADDQPPRLPPADPRDPGEMPLKGRLLMVDQPLVTIDTEKAHSARIYDHLLGGELNYAADRAAAQKILQGFPGAAVVARKQRSFMHRFAREAARDGHWQYMDIGTGIPTEPNLHQVVQEIEPKSRILYVDNDPIVLAHAADLLRGTDEGDIEYLPADARDPHALIAHAREHSVLDFDEPIAVSAIGLLHFLSDADAEALVRALIDAVAPGSLLALSQSTAFAARPEDYAGAVDGFRSSGVQFWQRDPDELTPWLDGVDVLDPGIVMVHRWRPDVEDTATDAEVSVLGMVGRRR